jgi:hypothetical protein
MEMRVVAGKAAIINATRAGLLRRPHAGQDARRLPASVGCGSLGHLLDVGLLCQTVINEWNLALICRGTADFMINQCLCVARRTRMPADHAPAGAR